MKLKIFLSTLYVSTALYSVAPAAWAMKEDEDFSFIPKILNDKDDEKQDKIESNEIYDHPVEKKNLRPNPHFEEIIDGSLNFNLFEEPFKNFKISKNKNRPLTHKTLPSKPKPHPSVNSVFRFGQHDLILCPISLDESLEDLQKRLTQKIVLGENNLKTLKNKLHKILNPLENSERQNTLKELVSLLTLPEELVMGSEKGSLAFKLAAFFQSQSQEKAKEILSHPAFKALDFRIERCEVLAKQLEGTDLKEASPVLREIKALYATYKQGFLKFNPITMEEDYNAHLAPKAELYGTLLLPSLIQQDLARQLVSRTLLDQVDKKNKEGTHAVSAFHGMHFKAYDYDAELGLCSGKELAMYHLYRLLIGEGVAPSTLICLAELPFVNLEQMETRKQIKQALLDKKSIDEMILEKPHLEKQLEAHQKKTLYPLQVSSSIEGMGFHIFLQNHFFAEWRKKNPERKPEEYLFEDHEGNNFQLGFQRRFVTFTAPKSRNDKPQKDIKEQKWTKFLKTFDPKNWSLDQIDEDSFARMTLMSFLTDPGDSKADNFMLTRKDNKWHIISIDTDRVLEPNLQKIPAGTKEGHHQVHHKSLFYTFPSFMKEKTLSQVIKEEFKKINPPLALAQWLLTLRDENKRYETLGKGSALPEKTYTKMKLPITFKKGQVSTLLNRLESLQKIFNIHDFNLTLDRTFELIHPILHAYYGKLQTQYPDPLSMIYADNTRENNQELTVETVLTEEGLKQTDEEGRTFQSILNDFNELVPTHQEKPNHLTDEQTLDETLVELITFVNMRAQENQKNKLKTSPFSLNMQELILQENHMALFKRMMNVQGPQAVNPNLGRRFYHKVIKKNQKDTELKKAWDLLVNHNSKLHWYMGLDHLFLSPQEANEYQKGQDQKNPKNVYKITSAVEGERYLPQEVWDQLMDKNNQFKRQNQDGAHAVGKAAYNGYTLYFKFLPKLPGLEEAVGRWTRNLIGFGAPHVELFRLNDDPILVSQEIKGLTLKETIKDHPERLKQLDLPSLSQLLFITMLTNPEDGKPDNYIVEQISEKPSTYRLIGVDNDQAFVPPVAREQKTSIFQKAPPIVQVKSVLFCLDQMDRPIEEETRYRFKSFDPHALISTWLNELDQVHEQQLSLFANEQNNNALLRKLFESHDSYMGIPFKKGDLHDFYDRFLRLQSALYDPSVITYHDLLMRVEPGLGKRYGVLRQDPKCPKDLYERFKTVDGKFFSQTMGTMTSGKDTLGAQGISEKEVIQDIIKKDRHYSPKRALEELEKRVKEVSIMETLTILEEGGGNKEALASEEFRNKLFKTLDFNHTKLDKRGKTYGPMPINTQQALLSYIYPYKLHDLTLINCHAFTFPILETNLQIQGLTLVNLRGCSGVTSQVPTYLSGQCSGLVHLDLSQCGNLTYIVGGTIVSSPLLFSNLQKLYVNQTPQLTQLNVEANKLLTLEAKDNPSLSVFKVQSASLKTVDVSKSPKITDETLDGVGESSPNLVTIVCKECPQLKAPEFREKFPRFPQLKIEKEDFQKIKSAYEQKLTQKLTELNLSFWGNNIGAVGAEWLSKNMTLTALNLGGNNIGDVGAEWLSKNTTLTKLYLNYNKIGEVGAKWLSKNTTLTTLNLGENSIGDVGTEWLSKNSTLTELDLYDNNIGPVGAEWLSKNSTLTKLNLHWNKIGDVGAEWLLKNTTLTELNLGFNKISRKAMTLIGKMLERNKKCREEKEKKQEKK